MRILRGEVRSDPSQISNFGSKWGVSGVKSCCENFQQLGNYSTNRVEHFWTIFGRFDVIFGNSSILLRLMNHIETYVSKSEGWLLEAPSAYSPIFISNSCKTSLNSVKNYFQQNFFLKYSLLGSLLLSKK